uniref:Uncharacterized protein n=1 Tax=Moniliophthora roreri TaxID=221103 RepID=A0A0W0GBM6_MONRR
MSSPHLSPPVSSPPHGVDLSGKENGFYAGFVLASVLLGITIVQAWIYVNTNEDRWPLRTLVTILVILDITTTVLNAEFVHHYLIKNFGNLAELSNTYVTVSVELLITIIIACIVELFFASRVHKLDLVHWVIPVFIVSTALAGLVGTAEVFKYPVVMTIASSKVKLYFALRNGFAALSDIAATIALLWSFKDDARAIQDRYPAAKTLPVYSHQRIIGNPISAVFVGHVHGPAREFELVPFPSRRDEDICHYHGLDVNNFPSFSPSHHQPSPTSRVGSTVVLPFEDRQNEMNEILFLQQQEKEKENPKSMDEVYLEFVNAFQDLQTAFSPEPVDMAPQHIAVDVLPQRIIEWFGWFAGTKIEDCDQLDWSCPLGCIVKLQPRYSFTDAGESLYLPHDTLESTLSNDGIHDLLQIFRQKYCGWLGFTIEDAHDPLLRVVCCALAARHLPEDVKWLFVPRLRARVEEMIKIVILNPPPRPGSLTTIKALLVWAVWLPVTSDLSIHDPRYLLSVAIDMATQFKLADCADLLLEMRQLEAAGQSVDMNVEADLLDKVRLWSCLINVDTMYSLRSGVSPHSSFGPGFATVFPVSYTIPTYLDGCQDLRIRIITDLLCATVSALKTEPRSRRSTDLDSWFRERRGYLRDMANLQRLLTLVTPLADFVKCQFSQMGAFSRALQLLVYYDVLYKARKLYETSPQHKDNPNNPFWCLEIRSSDSSLVHWMKDGLVLAEEILSWVVQVDHSFLATFPNHLFFPFAFSAIYVIGVKFIGFNALQTVFLGVDCQLLNQVVVNLNRAALWSGHPAKSCADFITTLLSLWNNRDVLFVRDD